MYGIITDTSNENTDSYIAYNDLSSDEDKPVSKVPKQSTNTNQNIAKCNNEVNDDEFDMSNADIENQTNALTLEILNNDVELKLCFIGLKICCIKLYHL